MRYVLCYWDKGQYNYTDLRSRSYKNALTEAKRIMRRWHIQAFKWGEWSLEQN